MINNSKIEKYKKAIEDLYKMMSFNKKEDFDINVNNMLDNDLKINKISEEEYNLLKDFLESFLKNLPKKDINSSMLNKYKVEELSPITMYKGEIGRRAPTREERKEQIRQESEAIRDEMKKEREGR